MRISLLDDCPDEVVLKIEGWISGENVDLLEQEGNRWLREVGHIVFDLSGVKSIDSKGLALLNGWPADKVALRGESPFVHMLLHQI